jgi:hypothetical protein
LIDLFNQNICTKGGKMEKEIIDLLLELKDYGIINLLKLFNSKSDLKQKLIEEIQSRDEDEIGIW